MVGTKKLNELISFHFQVDFGLNLRTYFYQYDNILRLVIYIWFKRKRF